MIITCDKRDLISAMNIAMRAVPARATMQILECARILTDGNVIHVTTNDMEFGIDTILEGTVKEAGAICLDAKLFNDIARKLPSGTVTISTYETGETRITCGKSKFNLPGKSADDFLSLPSIEDGETVQVSQALFRNLVQKTIFCVAQNDSNKMMTGELLEVDGDKLTGVALDGHRVAIRELKFDRSHGNLKAIVPGRSLGEIAKLLNGGINEMVNITFTYNHMAFQYDDTIIIVRLIAGDYFDYKKMLQMVSHYNTKVTVHAPDFIDSVNRAGTLVREGDRKPLIIQVADNIINMSVSTNLGSTNEDLEAEQEGEDIKIGFNPKLLIDAISAVDDDTVDWYMTGSKSPSFFKDDDAGYVYIVLPVNIQ